MRTDDAALDATRDAFQATIRKAKAVMAELDAPSAEAPDTSLTKEPDVPPEPWPVLARAAHHGLAGRVVRLLQPHTEADPVALLISLLAEFGTMLGRRPHLVLDGSVHPLLVWPVIVGTSSKSRKGTAGRRIQAVCAQSDREWIRGEFKGTLSSGEGLAYAVRDPRFEEKPIKERGQYTGDTVRVCVDSGVSDKRLFLEQSEFGAVLRVMKREGNSLSGVLRDCWDGQDLCPMTKTSRIKASEPHVTVVGHVTKDELLRNLDDTECSNGFGNRFLWLLVKRSKELPFASDPDPADLLHLTTELGHRIQHGRTVGRIELSGSAREAWGKGYHVLSAEKPGLAGSLLARGEAQVMRLSALYSLLDGQSSMEPVHLAAALAVWDFCNASTRQIFGDSTGDPVSDAILRALRARDELTESDISGLFDRNLSAARLEQAKSALSVKGLAHRVSVPTGGRPRIVWRAGTHVSEVWEGR